METLFDNKFVDPIKWWEINKQVLKKRSEKYLVFLSFNHKWCSNAIQVLNDKQNVVFCAKTPKKTLIRALKGKTPEVDWNETQLLSKHKKRED